MEFREFEDWDFDVKEISAGVYKVFDRDKSGGCIEFAGLDLEELLEKCKAEVREILSLRR